MIKHHMTHKQDKKPNWPASTNTDSIEIDAASSQLKTSDSVKLWQLSHNYHCAIIGTCLTMEEVKKLLRQLHINTTELAPYELHTTIVTIIAENNFPSKKVQRYLDKKFKKTIQKTKKMHANELKGFWKVSLYCGEIIDAFWAVMSHPQSDELMKKTFYGDIHMLSHMSGASNRVDLKRLTLLEKEKKDYATERLSWESKFNNLKLENTQLLNSAEQQHKQCSELQEQVNSLQTRLEQLMRSESTQERQLLDNLVAKLTARLDCQEKEIARQQSINDQLTAVITNQKQQLIANNATLSTYQNEVEYLQSALQENTRSQCPLQEQSLCGQCVLYVGGKKNLVPHYRELVEENSGVFIHHDGGIEKNTQDLQQSLSKADVVVFPSSCISHDAYWKIKRTCHKQNKPYKYLTSPGLYSLSNVLNKIMSTIAPPGTTKLKSRHKNLNAL